MTVEMTVKYIKNTKNDRRNYGEMHSKTFKIREMTAEMTVKYIQEHLKYEN